MRMVNQKDGGWAWVVVLASFATQFIAEGVTYTFGVYLVEISDEYNTISKSSVSWIASIMIGTYHAVGPVGSILVNRFGFLPVSICGSVLAAGGYAVSYFANGVLPLYFSIGILAGMGLSLLYLPSMVSVAQWFDKRRAFAIGISVSGSGLGTIFFEWITGFIIRSGGWRKALLIGAAMILCAIPFALLYRPFQEEETKSAAQPSFDNKFTNDADKVSLKRETFVSRILKWLTAFLNFSLLRNPLFMLFATCDLLMGIGYNIPYLYLPDIENTDTDSSTSTLLGIIGGASVIGRLVMGYFSDNTYLNRRLMYMLVLLLSGVVTVVCPHLSTLMWLRGYAAIYGACIGAYMTLKSVILVDLFGLERLTDAYGFLLLFQAFGFLIGPPIVGSLHDSSGDHNSGFYFAGSALVLSACISCFIPILQRFLQTNSVQPESAEVGSVALGSDNLAFEVEAGVDSSLDIVAGIDKMGAS